MVFTSTSAFRESFPWLILLACATSLTFNRITALPLGVVEVVYNWSILDDRSMKKYPYIIPIWQGISTYRTREGEMKTVYDVPYWQVVRKLDTLNHARRRYEQAADEEARQQADVLFTECYDWLTAREVPISYDPGPKLWLPRLPMMEM